MGKFIRFINQSIKYFFIINGENLGDGCNEFKNGLPDSFTEGQFVTALGYVLIGLSLRSKAAEPSAARYNKW